MKVQAKKAILSFKTKGKQAHTITKEDRVFINKDYKNVGLFGWKEVRNPQGDTKHTQSGAMELKHYFKQLLKPNEIVKTDQGVVLSSEVYPESIKIIERDIEIEAIVGKTNRDSDHYC